MAELKFEITQKVGILSEGAKGWSKELNLISWNDREPKYDIREWSPEHNKMGKGVTLSKEEVIVLRELLNGLDINMTVSNSKRVILADVLYSKSDETFYVLNGLSKYIENYKATSMKLAIELLKKDNWETCGEVQRHDYSSVDMLMKDREYIAIWEE